MSDHILTVITDGSGRETNHAAQREAKKLRENGIKVEGSSSIYVDAGGNSAVDLTWSDEEADESDTTVARPETFKDKLLRLSTEGAPAESRPLEDQPESSAGDAQKNLADPDRSAVLVPDPSMLAGKGVIVRAANKADELEVKTVGKTAKPEPTIRRARAKTTAKKK